MLIEIRTDADGVRNHSEIPTDRKRNIIGFFGDSFVENRRIEDRFSLTSILDTAAGPEARVVNYGVDGYGLDQSYLRYQKYQKHDIKHVVYVFCENDLRNLYETGLTEVDQDGDIIIRAAKRNLFYQAIGRMHLTYLTLTAYYKMMAFLNLVRSSEVSPIDWFGDAKSHRAQALRPNLSPLDCLPFATIHGRGTGPARPTQPSTPMCGGTSSQRAGAPPWSSPLS